MLSMVSTPALACLRSRDVAQLTARTTREGDDPIRRELLWIRVPIADARPLVIAFPNQPATKGVVPGTCDDRPTWEHIVRTSAGRRTDSRFRFSSSSCKRGA